MFGRSHSVISAFLIYVLTECVAILILWHCYFFWQRAFASSICLAVLAYVFFLAECIKPLRYFGCANLSFWQHASGHFGMWALLFDVFDRMPWAICVVWRCRVWQDLLSHFGILVLLFIFLTECLEPFCHFGVASFMLLTGCLQQFRFLAVLIHVFWHDALSHLIIWALRIYTFDKMP